MYTVNQVANLIGVSKFTVYKWIKQGTVNAVKIGGAVRIHEEEMNRVLKGRKA